jgi:glycine oxidase
MADVRHIAIIGGGVIGLSTAYFLAREGARVTLIDKGDFGQEASWAGAGILPPEELAQARTPIEQLRAHSVALFPSLSAELRELTGIDNGYARSGGLEFVRPVGEAAAEEWHAAGLALQPLAETEVTKLEPALASGLGPAFHLLDMAQVRNPRHVKALATACGQRGVRLLPTTPAQSFSTSGRRVTAVHTAAGVIGADRFLIAAGAWSEPLLQGLGWTPGIHPVRGQIVLLRPEAPVFRRILLWGSRYLVPRLDGQVLIGSTEEDVGFDKRTTAFAVADLIGLATSLVPKLAGAPVERCWAGLRPGSPDGLPYLGPVPGWENVFVAAGHFRAGLQLSPGTALVMKECLLDQPLTLPLTAFRLDRKT